MRVARTDVAGTDVARYYSGTVRHCRRTALSI